MKQQRHIPKAKPAPVQTPLEQAVPDTGFFYKYRFFILGAILLLTALIYLPSSLENDFTRYWDDETIVVQNTDIRSFSGEHIKNMFTKSYYDMYCPVKILSHTLDYQLFELNPAGYHLMSLFYHLINIILLFSLIYIMIGSSPAALAAALIYAVHPLNVETVSWVTGRGDLLYALFGFPALIYYVKYIKTGLKTKYLIYTFVFFILSGLSKPTAMTLPLTLLVFDWYYRRKLFSSKVIIEKLPFLAISIVLGILSIELRGSGAPEISGFLDFFKSYKGYLFVTYPLAFYIVKFIWPLPLSFIYPHVSYYFYNNQALPAFIGMSPFILMAVLFIIWKAKSMRRPLIFAGLFYFTTIFAVLQIIPVVAISAHDRYAYFPMFGFLFLLAYLIGRKVKGGKVKGETTTHKSPFTLYLLPLTVLIFATAFSFISYHRTQVWKGTVPLFEDVIKKQPRFVEGIDKLAEHYEILRDYPNVIKWTKKTLTVRNNFAGAYLRLVRGYTELNHLDSAFMYATYAVQTAGNPQQQYEAYERKAYLDLHFRRYTDALVDCDYLLKMNPNSGTAYYVRGYTFFGLGRRDEACVSLQRALDLGDTRAEEALKEYCR